MKYSFVLIAYNEEENITECIRSIMSLAGLGKSYEILVFDDGSTDGTRYMTYDLTETNKHLKLLGDGKNHGRGYGRYTGVRASAGDYIIMIDADIVLKPDWLRQVLPALKTHDAAGGIAVPDGDVAYIHRRFRLTPKTVMGSTTITGNNGIYKKAIFKKLNFNPSLREGEDVDFNHRMHRHGFTTICVPGLTVEHQEQKSFRTSMHWLYQSGVGATRQLINFKQVRLPDLAFAAMCFLTIFAALATIYFGMWPTFLAPVGLLLLASIMHLRGKFHLTVRRPVKSAAAILTHSILMFCYYIGRTTGPFIYLNNVSLNRAEES